ncbi:mix-type homeobox protein [Anaeramoeba flamelloides]|uniref:Mix-type homeobox protein n=1 Tax=Anaeramoeba flamelloides TaxID=1746091 RepID=A0ABQ8Y8A3_9EUKA|nr:mix-type homeobox protein [Anaeramoeba flamelloides]
MNLSTELKQQQQQQQQQQCQNMAIHQPMEVYTTQNRQIQNTLPYQQMRYPLQYSQSFQYFNSQRAYNQSQGQNYQLKQVPFYPPTVYMSNYPNMVQLKPNSFQNQFRKNDQSPKRIVQFPLTSPVKQTVSPVSQRMSEKGKNLNSDDRELNNQHLIFQNFINRIRITQNQQLKTSNNQNNSCLQKTEIQKNEIQNTRTRTSTRSITNKNKKPLDIFRVNVELIREAENMFLKEKMQKDLDSNKNKNTLKNLDETNTKTKNNPKTKSTNKNQDHLDQDTWTRKRFLIVPGERKRIIILKKKKKKRSKRLKTEQFAKNNFEQWFQENMNKEKGPYPDRVTRLNMSKTTGVPELQVQRWFGQRRRLEKLKWEAGKIKKPTWAISEGANN